MAKLTGWLLSNRVERRPSFALLFAVAMFGAAVLPGQWVPVLFVDDTRSVLLAASALAAGSVLGCAGAVRAGASSMGQLLAAPAIAGSVLAAGSIVYYRAVGGVGWPTWRLALTPIVCIVGGLVGIGGAKLTARAPRFISGAVAMAMAVVLASSVVAGASTIDGKVRRDRRDEVCIDRDPITYCVARGYEPLVDRYHPVVRNVLAAAPVVPSSRLVRQHLDSTARSRAELAAPGRDWGRGSGRSVAELAVGLDVADAVMGLSASGCEPGECGGWIIAGWLAAQGSRYAAAGLRATAMDEFGDALTGSEFGAPLQPSHMQRGLAAQLLRRDGVRQVVRERWAFLVDPTTTDADVIDLFELQRAAE